MPLELVDDDEFEELCERTDEPLENYRGRKHPGLTACVLCEKGNHEQCEGIGMPFCICWRQSHQAPKPRRKKVT